MRRHSSRKRLADRKSDQAFFVLIRVSNAVSRSNVLRSLRLVKLICEQGVAVKSDWLKLLIGSLHLIVATTTASSADWGALKGRFALDGLDEPLWVLWADADMRTLVIGTPSGRLGFILISQSRMRACPLS